MRVGIQSYYGNYINFVKKNKYIEDIRVLNESGNLCELNSVRSVEFQNECKKSGISLENYNFKNHDKYNLIIFWEIPNIFQLFKIKYKNLNKGIKTVLVIEETPVARNRNILLIPFLFDRVILNTEDNKYKLRNYKTSTFNLPTLPAIDEIYKREYLIKNSNRIPKIVYIGSNKTAINKQSSFRFRASIIKELNSKCPEIFDLYGTGWDRRQLPMDMPLMPLLSRMGFLKKILCILINICPFSTKSKGFVNIKSDVLKDFDFSLSIDPFLGNPKMVLEKLFDPMLCGSIPIYFGPKFNSVPENCFFRFSEKNSLEKIYKFISSLKEEEKNQYRENIYNFLISKKADKFRYETYAKFLIKEIRKFK